MGITLDFETRAAIDIRKSGAWVYLSNQYTEPLCLAFALDASDTPQVWVPDWVFAKVEGHLDMPLHHRTACPEPLVEAILRGDEVEAHNAFFDRTAWEKLMVARYGWPQIDAQQWRCSAAKAAAATLPRSLKGATTAVGCAPKDMGGNAIMLRVSKPRKVLKAERVALKKKGWVEHKDYGWTDTEGTLQYFWRESPEDLATTIKYCCQDVVAERELSQLIPNLSRNEQTVWRVDQIINRRGIRIDVDMVLAAIAISDEVTSKATKEAVELAGGAFTTLGQRDKILKWLRSRGVQAPNLQAATVQGLLDGDLPSEVRRVLERKQTCSKSSVKKYQKMLDTVDPADSRIRDVYKYHGASTGRWTGRFVQTQNLPRGEMPDPDTMCELISEGDPAVLDLFYAPVAPTTVLSWAIRGAICASPGRDLICADYSGVEARGSSWLVDDTEGLEVFSRPPGTPGIYREMAGAIYGVDPASIDKLTVQGAEQRQVGKTARLGLGYGMGAKKFMLSCANDGVPITEDFAKHVVSTYRSKFSKIVGGWNALEDAAIRAVRNPQSPIKALKVVFLKKDRFLSCRLPSGRKLHYFDPILMDGVTSWGKQTKKLTYMSVKTGAWIRVDTYGGKLFENVVQALCRDLEAAAIARVELGQNPYDVVTHTHDEVVAEVDKGVGSLEEFEELISVLPRWATGFPLTAAGWRGERYRK